MTRATLVAITAQLCVPWIVGCAAAPTRPTSGGKLPFVVRVKEVVPPKINRDEAVPALFPSDTTQNLADALQKIFVGVVIEDGSNRRADLEIEVRIVGSDFGKGKSRIPYAALSTLLWFAAGHLSWFIEDRVYGESEFVVRTTITIYSIPPAIEAPSDVVYSDVFVRDDLRLNNWERSRTSVGQALLNIIVPPWVLPGDPEVAGTSLAEKYLELFAREQIEFIRSDLPDRHLTALDCFLVHDGDRIILVSAQRIVRLEIGARVFGLAHDVARHAVSKDDESELRERLSSLQPWLSVREDDFLYVVELDGQEREIAVTATLDRGRGRWTILYEPDS